MSRPFTRSSSERLGMAALTWRIHRGVLKSERNDALLSRLAVGKRQAGAIVPIFKEVFPATEEDRMDHEPVFVDQPVLRERLDEFATAIDQDVLPGLLLQVSDRLDGVAR